ncbi:hypothetical protein GMORB2_5524 [Geosmithia morbida]|uniref:Glutamyl-tRNA amidotransferase complex subunit Gta3 domain-containing protein n=1 Tax=Geosmithia morbida TaxID=1094350 RepID=A0A9P4YY37_9HYPO|nr:uncharacterized protein GMORB2_5524 [Geosmithia morbida]KAF4123808.1 hypothetical protein GMORB2_5524 [Geosmithia morbida]
MSSSSSTPITPRHMLSRPTWSVRSLIPESSSNSQKDEIITPSKLHHLLRLCALPLPKSPSDEQAMISTLQSQLHFVRSVQRVDTTGVEPLRAVRDETDQATREATVDMDRLGALLEDEVRVGHYQRPRRRVVDTRGKRNEAEDWDALSTASRRAGRFFVVQSRNKGEEAP